MALREVIFDPVSASPTATSTDNFLHKQLERRVYVYIRKKCAQNYSRKSLKMMLLGSLD